MKIVMTGSASDPVEWQPHIRNKPRREELAKRFKDAKDPFKIVIVRDMWLTGFDAPCLHTMYVDKPMRGHGLMQAIARVNRVFKDKPGGLVVDYLGLADQLKQALATYTESGGKGRDGDRPGGSGRPDAGEVRGLLRHLPRLRLVGVDDGGPRERLSFLPAAQEHVLAQDDGKNRFVKAVAELSKAFALAVPHDEALAIRDDVAFFQAVSRCLTKSTGERRREPRGHRPRHPADRLAGGVVGRSDRHLRGRGTEEAGHLDPVRRVPGRSQRHAAAESGRGDAAEAAEGRDQDASRKTSCRRGRSPRCWRSRSIGIRTAPSRRRR